MGAVETQRTLVKSVPELWAELSGTTLLGRMLEAPFGEVRITRLTPESRIDWESELAAGCVELTPSGFGTRVRLSAQLPEETPSQEAANEPAPVSLRSRIWQRLRAIVSAPAPDAAEPHEEAPPPDRQAAECALTAVLDEIGAARHRPFSRRPSVR